MSAEPRKPSTTNSPVPDVAEQTEPTANLKRVPLWLIILFGILFYHGQLYLDYAAGGFDRAVYEPYRDYASLKRNQPIIADDSYARGEKVYYDVAKCVACHQPNGQGRAGQFPPLAGSELVQAEGPNRIIRVVLHGLNGPVDVNGRSFNGAMVPFGAVLSDKEIAAVLTFIRQNKAWGNSASAVKPEDVKRIRETSKGRETPWTAAELQKTPERE